MILYFALLISTNITFSSLNPCAVLVLASGCYANAFLHAWLQLHIHKMIRNGHGHKERSWNLEFWLHLLPLEDAILH